MTVRSYLVPVEFAMDAYSRLPKYFTSPGRAIPSTTPLIPNIGYSGTDFGLDPTTFIVVDVDAAQHSLLAAQPDVTVIPTNLDSQLGANLATVQAQLEALNLPADMLTATNTYRQVLRGVISTFKVMQKFHANRDTKGLPARLFPAGITLATTLGELSASVRQDLQAAVIELGLDYSGLTLASTLREVLKKLASQPVSETYSNPPFWSLTV